MGDDGYDMVCGGRHRLSDTPPPVSSLYYLLQATAGSMGDDGYDRVCGGSHRLPTSPAD